MNVCMCVCICMYVCMFNSYVVMLYEVMFPLLHDVSFILFLFFVFLLIFIV